MTPVELADGAVDGPGHGDVDDQQRPARRMVGLDVVARDDALARRRAGDDHVARRQRLADAVEAERPAADLAGEPAAALRRAVADGDLGRPGLVQRGGHADTHLAGTDDEHVAAGRATRAGR